MKKLGLIFSVLTLVFATQAYSAPQPELKCALRVTGDSVVGPFMALIRMHSISRTNPSKLHAQYRAHQILIEASAMPSLDYKAVTPSARWREVQVNVTVYMHGEVFFSGAPKLLVNERPAPNTLKTDSVSFGFAFAKDDHLNPAVSCFFE